MNYEDRVTKEYVENAVGDGLRLITGIYTGDGTKTRLIDLGVTPKMVSVWHSGNLQFDDGFSLGGVAFPNQPSKSIQLSATGFYVYYDPNNKNTSNYSGYNFFYIALY